MELVFPLACKYNFSLLCSLDFCSTFLSGLWNTSVLPRKRLLVSGVQQSFIQTEPGYFNPTTVTCVKKKIFISFRSWYWLNFYCIIFSWWKVPWHPIMPVFPINSYWYRYWKQLVLPIADLGLSTQILRLSHHAAAVATSISFGWNWTRHCYLWKRRRRIHCSQ